MAFLNPLWNNCWYTILECTYRIDETADPDGLPEYVIVTHTPQGEGVAPDQPLVRLPEAGDVVAGIVKDGCLLNDPNAYSNFPALPSTQTNFPHVTVVEIGTYPVVVADSATIDHGTQVTVTADGHVVEIGGPGALVLSADAPTEIIAKGNSTASTTADPEYILVTIR